MQIAVQFLVALMILTGPWCAFACADGGQVRVMERRGRYQLTVFTSPNPLRAGSVDVSVLVQDAKTGLRVPDVIVAVELKSPDKSLSHIRAAATTEAATNKLLRAALVELPAPGRWNVRVECATARDPAPIAVSFAVDCLPPLPRWLSVWPWFTWPIIAVLLFAIHRMLVARRQTRRTLGGKYMSAPPRTFAHTVS